MLLCLQILATTADTLKNFAVIYLVDLSEIPDFNTMYELYDPCTVMFFFRNKHIMIDLGTGNNNKINWAMNNKQEFIDIVEVVYRGARKGRGLVVSPKGNLRVFFHSCASSYALCYAPMTCCLLQTTLPSIGIDVGPMAAAAWGCRYFSQQCRQQSSKW